MEIPMPGAARTRRSRIGEASSQLRSGLAARVKRVRLASRVVLVGLLISCAGILWLNQTSTIVALGYEMQTIDKTTLQLNRQAEIMQSQVAAFENLKRIEEEARGKLGMVPATKSVYLKVQPTEGSGERGRNNPKLYPVNDWWRELTEMLPRPWQNSAPAQRPEERK